VCASAAPLGLARSLVDVAAWTVAVPAVVPETVAAAAGLRSRLAYRVERLMDPVRNLERPQRVFLPLAAVAVLLTTLVAPVVSSRADDEAADTPPPAAVVPAPVMPSPVVAPRPVARPQPIVAPRPAVARGPSRRHPRHQHRPLRQRHPRHPLRQRRSMRWTPSAISSA